jgi:hypothetical protein
VSSAATGPPARHVLAHSAAATRPKIRIITQLPQRPVLTLQEKFCKSL